MLFFISSLFLQGMFSSSMRHDGHETNNISSKHFNTPTHPPGKAQSRPEIPIETTRKRPQSFVFYFYFYFFSSFLIVITFCSLLESACISATSDKRTYTAGGFYTVALQRERTAQAGFTGVYCFGTDTRFIMSISFFFFSCILWG